MFVKKGGTSMKCENCGAELRDGLRCPVCGAEHKMICPDCLTEIRDRPGVCRLCGKELIPAWNVNRTELEDRGIHAFMPFRMERNTDIYLGGNPDDGGYAFENAAGFRGKFTRKIVLPGLVEGYPIYGIWNEFFCVGRDFAPERYDETFDRMKTLEVVEVTNGTRELFTYALYGCCGLQRLILPRTLKTMYSDFYDLFTDGISPMKNGIRKSPVTIQYRGSREEWEKVAKTSRIEQYIDLGKVIMEYDG